MISGHKKDFLVQALFVWSLLAICALVFGYRIYIPGITIGVLTAILNFNSLMTSIDKKMSSSDKKPSFGLTMRFFSRYLFVALIFALLIRFPNQLTGFIIGFLSLYATFFVSYVKRLKAGK